MTIQVKDIAATYQWNEIVDLELFNGDGVSIRVYDTDLIDKLDTDEWFFDDQQNIDWLLEVGHIIER